MPVFRNRVVLDVTRGVKAFLNLEVGATRAAVPDGSSESDAGDQSKLRQAQERLAESNQQLQRVRKREARKDFQIARLQEQISKAKSLTKLEGRLAEGSIVWVFGSNRTGSTWLASMLSEIKGHKLWNEPHVGRLFGHFYYEDEISQRRRNQRNYIMGGFKEPWLRSIRHFVLEGAEERFPKLGSGGRVVIKEPNASIGAPLLSEALPGSRLILLIRDPRDVVASSIDSLRVGGWRWQNLKARQDVSDLDLDYRVGTSATHYLRSMRKSKEAYEAHQGPKALVRYEDLRAHPVEVMKRLCGDLGLGVGDEEIARVVEKHSWENIPEDKKGEGKQHRKAEPGGWRQDLTPDQAAIVEEITAPLIKEFYS